MGATEIIFGGLGLLGIGEGRKARKEQKRANRLQEQRQRLQATRSAIEQVRQAQIARAEIVASGEAQGAGGSSAVLGGAGAVQSQAGGNIAFAQEMFRLQSLAQQRLQKAQDFGFRSQALGTTANIASQIDFDKMFASKPDPILQHFTTGAPTGGR